MSSEKTKRCPYCSEEILETAIKCKHCGEFLTKSDFKVRNIFKNYEKWLKQNYPDYNIVSKDEEEKTIVLNKQYKPFNIIIFILFLLLGILPGLIYAAITLLKGKIITLTIYFDNNGRVTKVSNANFKFLAVKYNNSISNYIEDNKKSKKPNKKKTWSTILSKIIIGSLLIIVGLAFFLLFFYITIPALLIWLIWKKSKYSVKTKIILSTVIAIPFLVFTIIIFIPSKTPIINISEPQNNITVQRDQIEIKGSVEPKTSQIKINKTIEVPVNNGLFSYTVKLPQEKNIIYITAINNEKKSQKEIVINRKFSEEEKAEIEKQKAIAEEKRKARAEEQKKAKIENLKRQLQREIDAIENFDNSKYRDSVENLNSEIMMFQLWAVLVEKNTDHENAEVQNLAKTLKKKLSQLQIKEFPLMRKNYAEILDKKMWEFDIDVNTSGSLNSTINFIGAHFAANRNIMETQQTLHSMLKKLRFDRANYKWFAYATEYDYYTIDSLKDSDVSVTQ